MRALIVAVAMHAVALGGCAAASVVHEPPELLAARDDARAQHETLTRLVRSVAAALDRPDACDGELCPGAARICELSLAICDIAGRHASDRELSSRCADGGLRCTRARERVDAVCECVTLE